MKKHIQFVFALGLAVSASLFLAGCGGGEEHADHEHGPDGEHLHVDGDGDSVEGALNDALGKAAGAAGDAVKLVVVENPTAEQIAAAKPYALDTCANSGEELGSMGDPVVLLVGDQQIKLCCDKCLPKVKENPAKILANLDK